MIKCKKYYFKNHPKVLPNPVDIVDEMSPIGICTKNPVKIDVSNNAIKGFNLNLIIETNNISIDSANTTNNP